MGNSITKLTNKYIPNSQELELEHDLEYLLTDKAMERFDRCNHVEIQIVKPNRIKYKHSAIFKNELNRRIHENDKLKSMNIICYNIIGDDGWYPDAYFKIDPSVKRVKLDLDSLYSKMNLTKLKLGLPVNIKITYPTHHLYKCDYEDYGNLIRRINDNKLKEYNIEFLSFGKEITDVGYRKPTALFVIDEYYQKRLAIQEIYNKSTALTTSDEKQILDYRKLTCERIFPFLEDEIDNFMGDAIFNINRLLLVTMSSENIDIKFDHNELLAFVINELPILGLILLKKLKTSYHNSRVVFNMLKVSNFSIILNIDIFSN